MSTLAVGDVVQVNPDHDPVFGGCLLVVTRVESWGVVGYVPVPGTATGTGVTLERAAQAFYRVPTAACSYIGKAEWVRP